MKNVTYMTEMSGMSTKNFFDLPNVINFCYMHGEKCRSLINDNFVKDTANFIFNMYNKRKYNLYN